MSKKILIIDDEPTIVMFLGELLSEIGYAALQAHSGNEGLKLLDSKSPPDLVIIDLRMPDLSGKEVVKRIRQNPLFNKVSIMIVTGCVKNDLDFPDEGTYQAYVSKPFDIEDMLASYHS